jgi:ABC-type polysaccharide/polyol phosphate transport system ATPase subunit
MNGVFRVFRREMNEKLPEIEAFYDIGKFFDRPVKTYSSGMFVRVALPHPSASSRHLPDEALADVKFQHKCYGAIREMQKNG